MQAVVMNSKREAGPILNVLLGMVVVTSIIGAVCTGIGVKIGSSFTDVSSVGSSFWWGGVVLLILGALYIPCHVLVKMGNSSGRALFIFWTFLIGIGLIIILASTVVTLVVWLVINTYNVDNCVYYQTPISFQPASSPCVAQCNEGLVDKAVSMYGTCCCCDTSYYYDSYKIVYVKEADGCSLFTDSFGLTRALLGMYIVGFILIFIDMIMAYIVACSCCDVQTPWMVGGPTAYTSVVTTQHGSMQGQQPYVARVVEPITPGYVAPAIPPKDGYAY